MNKYYLNDLVLSNRPITYGIVQPGPNVNPNGIPLIRGKDYSSGKVSTVGLYHVLPEIDKPYSRSKVITDDILLSIAGYVGQVAIVPEQLEGANLTQTTARLSCNPKLVIPKYLYYYLQSEKFYKTQVKKFEKGSAQSGLNLSDVGIFEINLPPLPQQRKIAKILSTVDAVIEKTEAAIAKYQQLKQGLMQDVFTRGIDVTTGKLRPKPEDAPDLYQASELGLIPKEWEVETVDSVAFLRHGYQFRDYDFVKEGIDVVKIGQIGKKGNVNLENSSKIASSRLDEFNSIQLFEGDILMALTGATLGKTAIIRNIDKPMLQNYRVGYFTPRDENKLNKLFLYYLLIGDSVQNEILGFVNAGAQGNIGKADFEKIKIIVPNSIQEQKLSSLKLQSIDQKIHTEQQALAKYQQLKAGLMQDLLTGEVSV
ncbi:restriction endonuclease subunit S [Mesonia sediminis]|uniref:Restriction endonuclease subunit S n=1 Tax=Mesonia sediminis TaxID=1703946 RepID=A0ABW5SAC4_9FLAO